MTSFKCLYTLGMIAMAWLSGHAAFAASTITGSASYRERIALPPAAVFEATLEDISRADAPATVLGRARIESPGNPPIRFSIDFDPAAIDARHRYVVRARITLDGQLMFTTDTVKPVLGPDHVTQVDLLLVRVGAARPAGPPASAAPAPQAGRFRGSYSYLADAGVFIDCASGRELPVATEGDNAALEAAYLKVRATPGAQVLAVVDGRIEMRMPMEGSQRRPTLIVERFVEILPGSGCQALAGPAPLENTYWKLISLRGTPVQLADKQREPHLILQPADRRVVGSGGCNRLMGSYTLDGERLAFSKTAGTMMACAQGVMALERAFLDTLPQVVTWRIDGQQLELRDGQGTSLAAFESRYLK
jgi:uncharacterized lipoprotein YbaY/heat shock protein HslJ